MIGVIMAGGKATRFSGAEKGLLKVGGKTLLERAADALDVAGIDERIVAVTDRTQGTADAARKQGFSVAETKGRGYHQDILELLDSYDTFASLNVDVPFAKPNHVERLLEVAEDESVASVVPLAIAMVEPDSDSRVVHEKFGELVWIGLNYVTNEPETAFAVFEEPLLSINVNTQEDLDLANRIAKERSV